MKKILSVFLVSLLISTNIFALEVDKTELQSTKSTTIEFISYTGPHKIIDSVEAIKGIGNSLGKEIAPSRDTSKTANLGNKYTVIHAIDENETGKFDADIIFINKDANVDHITNLRRIISAYLVSAYDYSEADADTLAVFITVYNAVYRGDLDSFKNKYKDVVVKNLSSNNCGLSVNYKDWPGASEIVIPLYDVKNGGLSTIETSVISDKKVVESMKEDDDKNIESRKEMVDIKEREAEESQEKANAAQKKAVEEQKKLKEEKQKTEKAKEEVKKAEEKATTAKKEAEEAKKQAEENPKDKQLQKEAEQKQEEAEAAEQEVEEKQEALEEQQEAEAEQEAVTEEAKQEAKTEQERADKKQNEAQKERKEIAQDQQIVQNNEIKEASMPSAYGIILSDEENILSRLVKFNTENGEVIKASPVTVIRNRTIYKTSDAYIAIAGENTGKGTIKLVLIDEETMEIFAESEATVSENSVLVKDGDDYYCVIKDGKNYVVAKYDEALTLKLKSKVNVTEATPITVSDSGIIVTDNKGNLKLLSKETLE
ncbi:MAG: hypothetical protein E7059_09715 [Treponema bryantii]|nr:hypothetical protein [Treponema bryantii]